ncbi:ABC transporter ATP-binding protein [Streptococcus sobrinus]|uniref:ABC transporter ATP-binding protein n=1 Tax=Streptococcus sobrinus TaxID=1310 RepID=UPI0003043BE3|nr:ABC transporter ATP-binding protein [Streptococcus sobrinus]
MLKIDHLHKTFGDKVAVKDLSLEIKAGDVFGFIGRNGAGKTTTIKSIVGISDFDSGEIFVNGHSIKKEPIACKKIMAYIPDNPDLYDYLTGIQYLNFIADIFELSLEQRKERMKKLSERFEISQALGQMISSYSHGMKQKLALIGALIHSPKLIILDEPFVGLDPKASFELKKIMIEVVEAGGAIFFSTHVLEVAEKICNKIAVLKDGQLLAQGPTADVKGNLSLEDFFMEVVE